jgi:hypothetical protein
MISTNVRMNRSEKVKKSVLIAIIVLLTMIVHEARSQEFDARQFALATITEAFQTLKKPEISYDNEQLQNMIDAAFRFRENDAVDLAMNQLRTPRIQIRDGKRIDRSEDVRLAKKILKQFPVTAVPLLSREYGSGNATLRGNVVEALGGLYPAPGTDELLKKALDDTDLYGQEEDPEMEGIPLRVCDIAYNQIVLRYGVLDVLRTLGTIHSIEVRDYHIEILKNKLGI